MAGRLVHFEIPAEDTARAQEFYEQLFGWSFQTWDGPVEYRMTEAGGDPGGAIYKTEGRPSGPVVYFDTDDIDGSIAKVRDNGGKADDKMPIPHVGWFARCTDTEGNPFSLYQSDESASEG